MRLRNIKNADEILNSSKYYLKDAYKYRGNFSCLFKNSNKIMLEIGMGKGDFLIGMAIKYPELNFIGVEKYESVLVKALKKLENKNLNNIYITSYDAINIGDLFNQEIDTIYLNFSDPWPKKRHYKRRLTYRDFLKEYDKCFINDAHIVLKTDNDNFFESSLVEMSNYGYIFKNISLDLWNTDIFNIRTEYENKFGNSGFKIKYLDAYKKIEKNEKSLI